MPLVNAPNSSPVLDLARPSSSCFGKTICGARPRSLRPVLWAAMVLPPLPLGMSSVSRRGQNADTRTRAGCRIRPCLLIRTAGNKSKRAKFAVSGEEDVSNPGSASPSERDNRHRIPSQGQRQQGPPRASGSGGNTMAAHNTGRSERAGFPHHIFLDQERGPKRARWPPTPHFLKPRAPTTYFPNQKPLAGYAVSLPAFVIKEESLVATL
jgi:hypothetical protein